MPNYKLTIEYDGTPFSGWQAQPDQPSVQEHITKAVKKLTGEDVHVQCAGRTDAGVHAVAQVANVVLEKEMDLYSLRCGLNFHMGTDAISILDAQEVDETFNARFSANGRAYMYRILNRQSPLAIDKNRAWWVKQSLDVEAMREAAGYLIGKHDFTSFRDSQCQAKSPIKTLDEVRIEQLGEEIRLYVAAQSFLHHMVRNITGTLVLVGKGNWKPEQVKQALEAKDRVAAGPTAPACGLYLTHVVY